MFHMLSLTKSQTHSSAYMQLIIGCFSIFFFKKIHLPFLFFTNKYNFTPHWTILPLIKRFPLPINLWTKQILILKLYQKGKRVVKTKCVNLLVISLFYFIFLNVASTTECHFKPNHLRCAEHFRGKKMIKQTGQTI